MILNTAIYSRFTTYLPLRAAPVGVNFGQAIHVADPPAAVAQLAAAYVALAGELRQAMGLVPEED